MLNRHDFIAFLRYPNLTREQYNIDNIVSVIRLVGKAYLYYYLVAFTFTLTIVLILHLLGLMDLYPKYKPIDPNALNIFKIIIVAPIFEELIFRLPLKFSKINITISVGLFLYLITRKIDIILAVTVTVLFLSFMILSLRKRSDFQPGTKQLFNKYFHLIFYFQALFFGFLHLSNFYLDFRYFYIFPLFIFTYVFMGCIAGYLRVRYTNGLYACILLHMFMNCISCLVH